MDNVLCLIWLEEGINFKPGMGYEKMGTGLLWGYSLGAMRNIKGYLLVK